MEKEVITDGDAYTIAQFTESGILLFRWDEFVTGEEFREPLGEFERLLEDQAAKRYMVDTSGVTAHNEEDEKWLAETWIPRLIDMGIELGTGVYADSTIAEMDMKEIEDQLSSVAPNYEFRVFTSEDAAHERLVEYTN